MDYVLGGVVVIFLCLLVVLPIGITYLSWARSKYIKYPISIVFSWYVFEWWRAFFPADNYFIEQFKGISGIDLPDTAKIIERHASYPDLHGDFDSCFVVELPKQDLEILLSKSATEPVSLNRNCNNGNTHNLTLKGENGRDYPFMSWYVTEQGYILGYYAQY